MQLRPLTFACVLALAWAVDGSAQAPAPSASQVIAPANRIEGPVSLTPQAAEELRRKVLVQCGLPASHDGSLPWYFHFEFGRSLLNAGDARRAVVQLTQSIDMNPSPAPEQRMYGMWYVDYLPYFQLAQAHARLGNWPCAANALELSRRFDESGFGVLDANAVNRLQTEIKTKSAEAVKTGACRKEEFLDPSYAEAPGG
jgi:hypothetical protein